jgi:hypothetical protein
MTTTAVSTRADLHGLLQRAATRGVPRPRVQISTAQALSDRLRGPDPQDVTIGRPMSSEGCSVVSVQRIHDATTGKRDSLLTDVLVLVGLLIAGLKLASGLRDGLDVGLSDEDYYVHNGVTLGREGLGTAVDAPLYHLWYFALSHLLPTTLDLYWFNFRVLTIAPFPLLYIFLRLVRTPIHIGFVVAWLMLVSRVNAGPDTRVSNFALIIILVTFSRVVSVRSLLSAVLAASLGALVTAYVRPEYFFVAISSFVALFVPRPAASLNRRDVRKVVAYVLCSAALLGVFGIPVGGNKSLVAFGDGFAMNWIAWTGSDLHPYTDSEDIVIQNFGPATGVLDALKRNPVLFAWHIAANLRKTVSGISVMKMFPSFFPGDIFTKAMMVLSILAACIVCRRNIPKNFQHHGDRLMILAWFVLPGILAAVIVTPKDHYLLLLGVISVALSTVLLAPRESETKSMWALVLAFFLIALTPYMVTEEAAGRTGSKRPNVETIRFIESLGIRETVNLLEAGSNVDLYVGGNLHGVPRWEKKTTFDQFRRGRNINMIVWSALLDRDSRFRADPEWRYFLDHYRELGWIERDIPNTDKKLIVRADLMRVPGI